jgi:hypothetical protein
VLGVSTAIFEPRETNNNHQKREGGRGRKGGRKGRRENHKLENINALRSLGTDFFKVLDITKKGELLYYLTSGQLLCYF